jgi:hypothetical protein
LTVGVEDDGYIERMLSLIERPEIDGVVDQFAEPGPSDCNRRFDWCSVNHSNLRLLWNRHRLGDLSHQLKQRIAREARKRGPLTTVELTALRYDQAFQEVNPPLQR